jgi:hypothetical protein
MDYERELQQVADLARRVAKQIDEGERYRRPDEFQGSVYSEMPPARRSDPATGLPPDYRLENIETQLERVADLIDNYLKSRTV